MSENEEAKSAADEQASDGIVLDLNFAPSWARTSPEDHIQRYQNERYESGTDRNERAGGRDRSRDRRSGYDAKTRDRYNSDRRPGPRREVERGGNSRPNMPRPESRGAVADLRGERFHDSESRVERGDRPDRRSPHNDFPSLPVEIRVLPEQRALGAVIRRIQTSHRAFPLRDIAWLFLDNPNSCLVRIEPLKEQPISLFQCKVCGMPALSEEEIRSHLINRHMDDFFDVEEVDCDPPSGAFVCVARCGLSGELLGPPNHHSFNAKVHEMLRTRYPEMSEEAYRSRIETVRETDVIEQWRQQCTKKRVYRRKGAEPTVVEPVPVVADEVTDATAEAAIEQEPLPRAPVMERDVAELVFLREILPSQVANVRHLLCTAAIAMQTTSRPLFYALKDSLTRERRFPSSLFFALRGAFRHRKLHLFRVNDPKGQDFVMLKMPNALDPDHAVQALREVLTYVTEHPACSKVELATELAAGDEAKLKETLIQLAWLVEKGHVVHFYNDVLSAPLEYPAFRVLPGEKQAGGHGGGGPRRSTTPPSRTAHDGKSEREESTAVVKDVVEKAQSVEESTAPAEESATPVEESATPAEQPAAVAETETQTSASESNASSEDVDKSANHTEPIAGQ